MIFLKEVSKPIFPQIAKFHMFVDLHWKISWNYLILWYCRANTILISKKLFISKRHFLVFFYFTYYFSSFIKILNIIDNFLPLILLIFNFYNEMVYKEKFNLLVTFCGTLCQFLWIFGFLWCLISIFKLRNKNLILYLEFRSNCNVRAGFIGQILLSLYLEKVLRCMFLIIYLLVILIICL